ncbi:MAG: low molecular weight protein arginine phosphatase [Elusimicrobia bacterium]|nr:low molecular weight protein arginine phosphatase [Elusimicrobiota bacterium]
MKILFICTGNTCRSVLARYYAAKLAGEGSLPLEFSSAGLAAEKDTVQPHIVPELLKKEGVTKFNHQPTRLTVKIVESADLILTMTGAQKAGLTGLFPEAAAKTMTLLEYAGFGAEDISDPYGRDDLFYFKTFELIKAAVKAALEKLKKEV